jgi:UDPglucose 6-dehydrogenase
LNVAILGTGYVGLTTGACLAYLGHRVTCVDPDDHKIAALHNGGVPFYEPHLDDLIALARHNLSFTRDYALAVPGAQVVFIAVGTPPGPGGAPDLTCLQAAARGAGEHLSRHFTVIVNKSTVPIGSGNWVGSLLRDAVAVRPDPNGSCFAVASNPEFLREGSAIADTLYPDRIVVGADEPQTAEVLYTLYRPILDQTFQPPTFLPRPERLGAVPLISTDLASAELIKYAANAFLALKISYINEIGQLAEKVGADIRQVARGIGLDARIGTRFLEAGIGWGGSCFGKDTAALVATAGDYALEMPIVSAARQINLRQRAAVVAKLLGELKILKGRTVGILGLAFKPNTDDLRDAPALDIAQHLIGRGARVKVHDPVAMPRFRKDNPDLDVILCDSVLQASEGADALVLATEWPEYTALDWERIAPLMKTPVILDGRSVLDRARLSRAGFRYLSLAG